MATLTIPAALSIALQCAPSVDPHMLIGIGQHESGLETEILHDNSTGKVQRGPGVIEVASQLIAAGHSVDLGLMQINSRNLGLLGLGLADAFDACRSIAGAARLMSLFSAYNTGSPTRGVENGYAQAVVASIEKVRVVAALPPAFTPATTPSSSQPKLRLRDQVVSFSTR